MRGERSGGVLALFKSMLMDRKTRAEHDQGSIVKGLFEHIGFISGGWVVGAFELKDYKVPPFSNPTITGFEIVSKHLHTGVLTSEYYDLDGNLVGRKYFDLGDVKKIEMMKHLQGLDSNLKQGRPLIEESLSLTSEEIVEKIKTRKTWYVHSDKGAEYEPTHSDAYEQIACELGLITNESTEGESVEATKRIMRIYMRDKNKNN